MRALSLGVAACLVAAAFSAACGSSGGSGEGAGPDPDAGPARTDGPDGDVPGPDAGRDADPADAKRDVVVSPNHYCAKLSPAPRFCDDFDDGDLTNDWDVNTVLSGSTIALDDAQFASGPFSYVVQTKALTTAGSSGNALLRKTVLGTVKHPKLSFSAFFPSVTFTKGIIAIATLDVSSSHYFTLNLRDQDAVPAASLEEFVGATMTRHVLTRLPPAGVWTRITVDLDFTTGKANVSFGADKALADEPIMAVPGTETTIRLGAVYCEGPADPFLARFDDVVVEF